MNARGGEVQFNNPALCPLIRKGNGYACANIDNHHRRTAAVQPDDITKPQGWLTRVDELLGLSKAGQPLYWVSLPLERRGRHAKHFPNW